MILWRNFSENICNLKIYMHMKKNNSLIMASFADMVTIDLNMFISLMKDWIVNNYDCTGIVNMTSGVLLTETKFR